MEGEEKRGEGESGWRKEEKEKRGEGESGGRKRLINLVGL
jgi:hypothetical protein